MEGTPRDTRPSYNKSGSLNGNNSFQAIAILKIRKPYERLYKVYKINTRKDLFKLSIKSKCDILILSGDIDTLRFRPVSFGI